MRGGAEYEITPIGLRIRGGFIYTPSPFQGDPSSFDKKTVTGGVGFMLGDSAMLDAAFGYGWWKNYRVNYSKSSSVQESLTDNLFLLTLVYRI
jgi:long-subunit fatty acid transport protein